MTILLIRRCAGARQWRSARLPGSRSSTDVLMRLIGLGVILVVGLGIGRGVDCINFFRLSMQPHYAV